MSIKIKVSDVIQTANILNDLIEVTKQPFVGNARRLLFKLQPEIKYIQQADQEDLESVQDKEIDLGEQIPAPDVYIDEYRPILEKLCGELPEQTSQIGQLVDDV